MGNQAESFEDGGADHPILEEADLDATHDANGHLAAHTNRDTNPINPINPQHGTGKMEGGNPHLQAILPNGDQYEDESEEADQPNTKPPPPPTRNENENMSVGVGVATKKKKTKSKSKSKRGLVKSNRNQAQGESDLMTYDEGSTDRL